MFDIKIMEHPISKLLMSNFVKKCPKKLIYLERLVEEFHIIIKLNFTNHLLLVVEFLKLIRENTKEVHHIIRGSSGSSLVCYCLGITNIDPVKYNICFSRFLNDKRTSMPDIDMDFPYNRRDEIFDLLNKEYPNKIARISNHIMYKEKSAMREALREKGYRKFVSKHTNIEKKFSEWKDDLKEKQKNLMGKFRCYSLHCGGIVFYKNGIPEELKLETKTINQIKYNKDDVDKKKLFKIDILSNRGLAQLLSVSMQDLESYPNNDDKITRLFRKGKNIGLTFSESPAMRKLLISIQPKKMEDIAFCLALVRPAAAPDSKSKVLREVSRGELTDSIIYDDDAIKYIHNLIKCDKGSADMYRKSFSKNKFKKIEYFNVMLDQFGYDENKKKSINKNLNALRKYSFCKSHALSYAQLVWALAYQKVYNPKKFWLSNLNHCHSMYRKWVHFCEAKKAGLKITLGRKPWILKEDTLISVYKSKKGKKSIYQDNLTSEDQYKLYGYWTNKKFIDGMFCEVDLNKTKYGYKAKFRCLIAAGRKYKDCTFVTLGYANGKYLDCTISKKVNYYYDGMEGEGYIRGYLNTYPVNFKDNSLRLDAVSYKFFKI
tara:strand:+ start:312 stop:2114 length:1803 start_codon:yes stop_codon:yes gene_type:complete